MTELQRSDQAVIERRDFQQLLDALGQRGYLTVGPVVRDQTVIYDELTSVDDMPVGYVDTQDGGTYRLEKRNDRTLFSYVLGPHSWKKYLYPSAVRLWQAQRENGGFHVIEEDGQSAPRYALIGARACELQAIAIQDRVLTGGPYVDPTYKLRRENLFVVAVNCGRPGGTCFCASMKTGPKAKAGFDLALTEIADEQRHFFVVEVGSVKGTEILNAIPHRDVTKAELKEADRIVAEATEKMGRTMDTAHIKELLYNNSEHPRWEDVASRCLTCGNCTMVCPTCFCTNVEDVTDLTGEYAERWRRWDSCFTVDFSYIHGGSIRTSAKSRYRQWMTHKLASWIDQFGTSGCVGCGRCITWCPVGIDITQEVRAIRENSAAPTTRRKKRGNA